MPGKKGERVQEKMRIVLFGTGITGLTGFVFFLGQKIK
jgi:hypothetical protein